MLRIMSLLAVLLWSMSWIDANCAEPADEEYFNLVGEAEKAIKDGRWAEAEESLRKAMRSSPSNPTNVLLLSNLGMVQFYDGRAQDAIRTLSDAHAMAPASVTVLLNRARVFTSEGMNDQAERDYAEVIRLDSTLCEPRFYRAMLALNRGDVAGAVADVDTLVTRNPDDRLTHVALATLLIHSSKYAEAIPHLTAAIKSQPDASYYAHRALCYLFVDDPSAASADIAEGLELDPTDGELYLYRGLLNKMRFRPDDAKADGEKAVKFGVDPAKVKQLLE